MLSICHLARSFNLVTVADTCLTCTHQLRINTCMYLVNRNCVVFVRDKPGFESYFYESKMIIHITFQKWKLRSDDNFKFTKCYADV